MNDARAHYGPFRGAWVLWRWARSLRRRGMSWIEILAYLEEVAAWGQGRVDLDERGGKQAFIAKVLLDIERGRAAP